VGPRPIAVLIERWQAAQKEKHEASIRFAQACEARELELEAEARALGTRERGREAAHGEASPDAKAEAVSDADRRS